MTEIGSTLFLYTDGLSEAADPDETEYAWVLGKIRLASLSYASEESRT